MGERIRINEAVGVKASDEVRRCFLDAEIQRGEFAAVFFGINADYRMVFILLQDFCRIVG